MIIVTRAQVSTYLVTTNKGFSITLILQSLADIGELPLLERYCVESNDFGADGAMPPPTWIWEGGHILDLANVGGILLHLRQPRICPFPPKCAPLVCPLTVFQTHKMHVFAVYRCAPFSGNFV